MKLRRRPDKQKAKALREMAEQIIERLDSTDKMQYAAQTLTDYYDAIHNLLEAKSAEKGVKIKGEGAHEELIRYMAKTRVITEAEKAFLQDMRNHRNRIRYEGFSLPGEFIEENESRIRALINKLSK